MYVGRRGYHISCSGFVKDKLNCQLNCESPLEVSYCATVTYPLHLYCRSRIVVNFDNSSKLLLVMHKEETNQKRRLERFSNRLLYFIMSPVAKIFNNYFSSSNGF